MPTPPDGFWLAGFALRADSSISSTRLPSDRQPGMAAFLVPTVWRSAANIPLRYCLTYERPLRYIKYAVVATAVHAVHHP